MPGQGENYGGKQPDNSTYIKQFVSSATGYSAWIYKNISNVPYITTSTETSVLIQKDLIVNGSITNSSDIKLKENIEELTDEECDKILQIKPKKYTYKHDETKKIRYGIIAQEIEHIFPHLVNVNILDKDNECLNKSVNYIDIIPILLCKIQKMQKEIDALHKMIKLKND